MQGCPVPAVYPVEVVTANVNLLTNLWDVEFLIGQPGHMRPPSEIHLMQLTQNLQC